MSSTTGREAVISNGQRAMHLQQVNIAVRVSDLAATTSAYFGATAAVGKAAELETLIPDLREFAELISHLQLPSEGRRYRALIPSEVWKKGTDGLEDLSAIDSDISTALEQVERESADPEWLRSLSDRLNRLSNAFSELSRTEFDRLVDPSTASA